MNESMLRHKLVSSTISHNNVCMYLISVIKYLHFFKVKVCTNAIRNSIKRF